MRRVRVYRTRRRQEMYLYVDADEDLARVPDALLERFGVPIEALALDLHPGRPLARADVAEVLRQIEATGFYLQMPPAIEESLP
ncbi:MAG: YcgL domain-containing protein [Pseudomonadales bacterium]